ncbi:MAG: SRPBCC family protein [Gemmatimonadaceae bacterium]|nr:SRPBCC family protein [Gemmatimonadaceae bacterium]
MADTMLGRNTWVLTTALELPISPADAFTFFSDAANLERITPRDLGFEIRTPAPITMRAGTVIDYVVRLHGIPMQWRMLIPVWDPPHRFVDEQTKGPYALWQHEHRVDPSPLGSIITDRVRFRLPFSPLGDIAIPIVKRQLLGIFGHRQRAVAAYLLGGRAGEARITAPVIAREPKRRA